MMALTDALLRGGLLFLLAFTPLAFGMIHTWAVAIVRVAGVLLLAVWLIRHALTRVPSAWRMPVWAMLGLAYVGINVASLAVSVNLDDSQEEVANLLVYLAVFFLTAQTCRTPRHALQVCGVQVGVAVVLSVYSILQHYGIDFIPWNPPVVKRSFATLANPNRLAGYLIMIAPLLMAALVGASSRWVRVGALMGTVVVYLGLVFTYSRGGWLALLVSLGCLGMIAVFWQGRRPTRRGLIALVAVIALFAAVTVPQQGTRLLRLKEYAGDRMDIGVRMSMWKGALNIIAGHPWLGTGIGTYRTAIYQAEPEELQQRLGFKQETPTYSHNDYLQTASEIGLPGLGVWLALLFFSLLGCGTLFGGIRSRPCACWC